MLIDTACVCLLCRHPLLPPKNLTLICVCVFFFNVFPDFFVFVSGYVARVMLFFMPCLYVCMPVCALCVCLSAVHALTLVA